MPPGAYEVESLNNEIKRIVIDEEHFTAADYPFKIKPHFSTSGNIIQKFRKEPIFSFLLHDCI